MPQTSESRDNITTYVSGQRLYLENVFDKNALWDFFYILNFFSFVAFETDNVCWKKVDSEKGERTLDRKTIALHAN